MPDPETLGVRSRQDAILKKDVKSLTIDRTAPMLNVSGIFNGIDWGETDQLKVQISDLGSGLVDVTYPLNSQEERYITQFDLKSRALNCQRMN